MYRTKQGLMSGGVIENKHWIKHLLMHAVGTEDYESAGEGEFRLDVLVDNEDDTAAATGTDALQQASAARDEQPQPQQRRGLRLEYTCNVVYTHDGVKLTLAPVG